ncbi:hypothetical protein WR25_04718 [Diploscapter pachys]|uniref:Uncharacterized protein n=1 Tax=Diploscapter pachys TaxID=2018661 RepID=A0A2A2L6G6_9BILA|nr:hypothetical protein WR25_04718 [Diploscapter pachys]
MSKERIGLMDANGGSAETGRGIDETGMAGGFAESVEQKMDAVRDWFASHCCGFVKEVCLPSDFELFNQGSCQSPFSCPLDDSSHNLICLNGAQLCDGIAHCPDKFDETFYCKSECKESEHKCGGQNLCLPQEALCNGIDDCRDGSDEKDCEVCIQGAKMCNGRKCVAASRLCDGKSDCEDASDEKTEMVRCSDSRFYPLTEACRGELSQCASSCPDCHPTAAFACRKEHKCIQQSMVCNGIPDCVGGEDERDCDRVCDLENSFKCARSNKNKCIPAEQRCDGIWHCEDKSDEMNCREVGLMNRENDISSLICSAP